MKLVRDRPRARPRRARPPWTANRLVAVVLAVAACWATLLLTTPPSSGLPVLTSTSPGNGEIVKSPDDILLSFDRPVPAGLATVRMLNPSGEQVIFRRPFRPSGRADTIAVPMPKTRYAGTYTVAWTLPSSRLDPVRGTFTFDVFSPSEPAGALEVATDRDPVVAGVHSATRFAATVLLVLLVGTVFFVSAIWPGGARMRRLRRVVNRAWLGLVLATVCTLVSFGAYAAWAPAAGALDLGLLSGAFQSDVGAALLGRLYVLAVATVGVGLLLSGTQADSVAGRWSRGAAVVGCAAALAATWSYAGPRLGGTPTPVALATDTAVLVAIALPTGGLVPLWMLLRRGGQAVQREALRRFCLVTAVCAVVLAVAAVLVTGGLLRVALLVAVAMFGGGSWAGRRWVRTAAGRGPDRFGASRRWWLVWSAAACTVTSLVAVAVLPTGTFAGTASAREVGGATPPSLQRQSPPARLAFDTGSPPGRGAVDVVTLPVRGDRGGIGLRLYVSVLDEHGSPTDAVRLGAAVRRTGEPGQQVPVSVARAASGRLSGSVTVPGRGRWDLALTVTARDGTRQTLTQPIDVR